MTERITTLLHEEADELETPTFAADPIITRGRRMRRRTSSFQILAAAAVVGVVAASAMTWMGNRESDDRIPVTSGVVDGGSDWAFGVGSSVHLSSGGTVTLAGTVKSLYYTSDGVLVRTGQTSDSDAPDSNYWLITNDGKVSDFRLSLGDRVPSTDPDEPFIAYAEPGEDARHWTVIIRDVGTGEVVHSVPIEGKFTWGGWVAPPVALDGDHVYVGVDDALLDVNWRDGTVVQSETLPGSYMPTVRNNYELVEHWHPNATGGNEDPMETASIVNVASGQERRLPGDLDETVATLSIDGRSVLLRSYSTCNDNDECSIDEPVATLYDIATGSSSKISLNGATAVGYTRDGQIVQVGADFVSVCDTAGCQPTQVDVGRGDVKVAGSIYES